MLHMPCRKPSSRARMLLAALLLGAGLPAASADTRHAPWHELDPGAQLDQLLAALVEEPGSNRLFLTTDTESLRSALQQLCPASAAHCRASTPNMPAALHTLAPAELELLLQQLASRLQATPGRPPRALGGSAGHGEDDTRSQRPLASL